MSDDESVDLSFLTAGRAELTLVSALTGALNVARLHDLGNVAVTEAIKHLSEALTAFLEPRDQVVILVTDQRVYVNGRLVRGGGRNWQDDFLGFMDRMALGGMVLGGSWTAPTVKQLLSVVRKVDKGVPRDKRPAALRREAEVLPAASELVVLDPGQAELFVQEESEGYVSEKERASYYYGRLLALAEAAFLSVAAGGSPDVHVRHLRQSVMRVVDHLPNIQFETRLLGLTCLEPVPGAELAQHGANVAVLAAGMGRLLGLERGSLADLVYAGLFHDLGRVGEESRVLAADGSGEDYAAGEGHVVRAVARCLRARQYGSTGLLRLIAGQEHHLLAEGYPQPALRSPHVFSQIVAVADAYDRLENGLPWRPPVPPRQALRRLLEESPYPLEVVALLRDLLGTYPRGTTLRLWDGTIGVVITGGARRGHRPIVRRLLDSDMSPAAGPSLVELPNPDQVAEEVDAEDFSIDWRSVVIE